METSGEESMTSGETTSTDESWSKIGLSSSESSRIVTSSFGESQTPSDSESEFLEDPEPSSTNEVEIDEESSNEEEQAQDWFDDEEEEEEENETKARKRKGQEEGNSSAAGTTAKQARSNGPSGRARNPGSSEKGVPVDDNPLNRTLDNLTNFIEFLEETSPDNGDQIRTAAEPLKNGLCQLRDHGQTDVRKMGDNLQSWKRKSQELSNAANRGNQFNDSFDQLIKELEGQMNLALENNKHKPNLPPPQADVFVVPQEKEHNYNRPPPPQQQQQGQQQGQQQAPHVNHDGGPLEFPPKRNVRIIIGQDYLPRSYQSPFGTIITKKKVKGSFTQHFAVEDFAGPGFLRMIQQLIEHKKTSKPYLPSLKYGVKDSSITGRLENFQVRHANGSFTYFALVLTRKRVIGYTSVLDVFDIHPDFLADLEKGFAYFHAEATE